MIRTVRRNAVSSNPWLATFTDLAALILAFFVLTFSMLVIREDERESTSQTLETAVTFDTGVELFPDPEHAADPRKNGLHPGDVYLSTVLGERLKSLDMRFEPTSRGMDILLDGLAHFAGDVWSLDAQAVMATGMILSSARSTGRTVAILVPRGREDDMARALARGEAVLAAAALADPLDIVVIDDNERGHSDAIGFRLERK